MEISGIGGGWGYEKHSLEWKFQGGGGSKTKVLSIKGGGGMDIFWNYTIYIIILILYPNPNSLTRK